AIPLRCRLGRRAVEIFLPGLRRSHLHHLPIEADPAKFPALPLRLLWRIVTLATFRLAIGAARLDHLIAHAAPAGLAVLDRLFPGSITLTALGLALRVRDQDDAPVDAAVAIVRRRRRRRATAVRGTGQRRPPAMRRLRRTRRAF